VKVDFLFARLRGAALSHQVQAQIQKVLHTNRLLLAQTANNVLFQLALKKARDKSLFFVTERHSLQVPKRRLREVGQ